MIDFKTYLIKERIIDYYTIYPFEDITQIPDFYMAKKSGLIEDVRIETCGINGGDIKQLPLMRQHLTGKFYISVDVFNAHWKKLKIGLEDADRHVRINLLRKLGRVAIFNSDEISFESCGDLETMEYIERKHRNRIFDNRALLYIYSDASYTVHDKSCKLVDKIPDEYIQGSEEMPENYIFCKSCKHRLMLRKLIGQDTKNLELYEKFLNRGKVDRKYLELLYQAKKAALYLENPYALRIIYNNDAWKVKSNLEGELVELLKSRTILG